MYQGLRSFPELSLAAHTFAFPRRSVTRQHNWRNESEYVETRDLAARAFSGGGGKIYMQNEIIAGRFSDEVILHFREKQDNELR